MGISSSTVVVNIVVCLFVCLLFIAGMSHLVTQCCLSLVCCIWLSIAELCCCCFAVAVVVFMS